MKRNDTDDGPDDATPPNAERITVSGGHPHEAIV